MIRITGIGTLPVFQDNREIRIQASKYVETVSEMVFGHRTHNMLHTYYIMLSSHENARVLYNNCSLAAKYQNDTIGPF